MNTNNPLLSQSRKTEIDNSVLRILEKAQIKDSPVDLGKIADCFGWHITTVAKARAAGMSIPADNEGFAIVRSNPSGYDYIIVYNENSSSDDIRNTIAHEIGHISLGHLLDNEPAADAETEADYFAARLLNPLAAKSEKL